jgi:hypothetical protein
LVEKKMELMRQFDKNKRRSVVGKKRKDERKEQRIDGEE